MILVVATCFFRKSHSIKCTTHPKTHKQPTTHKCHNPQPTKSKSPFSIMDEDCSQMLRDIRVQGPPRISRSKKVRDIRGLRDIRVRTSRGYLVKVRDIRGVRDIRVQGPPRISRTRYPRGARYPRATRPQLAHYLWPVRERGKRREIGCSPHSEK